ncbi:MAG: dihydropteroate synthase [Gammaproteobacteria bacterium]|nr:dihydropteroate synthase [Gammaproteobacteria bacterium]
MSFDKQSKDCPLVMGILNVTPDSFSDGGRYIDPVLAMARVEEMVAAGADIIDIGGESTRPGAPAVSAADELERVIPLVGQICERFDVMLSVDTSKPAVMRSAIEAGAGMINDVFALREPGAVEAVAGSSAQVCLMHMQGEPRTMQENPVYSNVVAEVGDFLLARAEACLAAGIGRDRIFLDPGFGFGKTLAHNLELMAGLDKLLELGFPLSVGVSRKSMFGALLGRAVDERLAGSVAMAAIAAWSGASIIRAHDIAETKDAVCVAAALRGARKQIRNKT